MLKRGKRTTQFLKGVVGIVLLCTGPVTPSHADSANQAKRPNFVFVLGEGQGWVSTSVQMHDRVASSKSDSFYMPSLERLAREKEMKMPGQ